jgi:hypothetical protein
VCDELGNPTSDPDVRVQLAKDTGIKVGAYWCRIMGEGQFHSFLFFLGVSPRPPQKKLWIKNFSLTKINIVIRMNLYDWWLKS